MPGMGSSVFYENLARLSRIASRISFFEIGSFTLRTSKGEVCAGRITNTQPSRPLNLTCPSVNACLSKTASYFVQAKVARQRNRAQHTGPPAQRRRHDVVVNPRFAYKLHDDVL